MAAAVTEELDRLRQSVVDGNSVTDRARVKGAEGDWAVALGGVNDIIDCRVTHMSRVIHVIQAVSRGDLSQSVATEVNGRWQADMAEFFVDLGDARPDTGFALLEEVFHLEDQLRLIEPAKEETP